MSQSRGDQVNPKSNLILFIALNPHTMTHKATKLKIKNHSSKDYIDELKRKLCLIPSSNFNALDLPTHKFLSVTIQIIQQKDRKESDHVGETM